MAAWQHKKKTACPHLSRMGHPTTPSRTQCGDCEGNEDLRLCLTCGYVGCCESRNSHDTRHFEMTGHPLIRPYRCDYDWLYCYECQAFLD